MFGSQKKEKSMETGNIWCKRPRKNPQIHYTICVRHHYANTHTNNVSNTSSLLQTIGGKDERTDNTMAKRYKDKLVGKNTQKTKYFPTNCYIKL
jgi:hypothetical protein